MKTINRTILRSMRYNLSYYISIALLTALTVFLVSVVFSDAYMIADDIEKLMAEGNVEAGQFLTAMPLTQENIQELEGKYSLAIEENGYMDVSVRDKSYRIFKPSEKINKYQLLEGSDIQNKYEILLDRDFASSNKISVGSNYQIDGVDFKVVGLAIRPDYIYSPKNLTDAWVDKANFALVQVDAETYNELRASKQWNGSAYYSVVYNDDANAEGFRRCIYDSYGAYSYMSSDANVRISKPQNASLEMLMLAWFVGPLLFTVIIMLVSVVIGRMMEREKKHVGTLLSFGYRLREIGLHYSIYAVIPAVIGGILGLLLAVFAGEGVAMYFVYDYQLINYNYYIRPIAAIICLVAPTLLYGLVAYTKASKMFKKSIASLLTEREDNKRKKRRLLETSKLSFKRKLRIRELLSRPARTFLVLLCLFLSAFMSLFGFALGDTVDKMAENGIASGAVYKYSYYLNQMVTDNKLDGLHGISVSYEMSSNATSITLNGLPANSEFENMPLLEGEYCNTGCYVSNAVAIAQSLHKGDYIKIRNTVTMEETEIKIDGIVHDNTQQAIYTSYENAKKLIGIEENYYNVVYSNEELAIPEGKLAYTCDTQSILEILDTAMTALNGFVYGLVFIGCLLGVISVYLIVNMLIEENKANISMLKVLGYRNGEINSIILSTNHVLVVIGFALAVPLCYGALSLLSIIAIPFINVVLEPHIAISSIILSLGIILASYFLSLFLLRRKVDRVDMVVALKGNRE